MTTVRLAAFGAALLGSTAAWSQTLPVGVYSFAGGTSGSCLHAAIGGYLVYPGPGKTGFEIGVLQDAVTVQVFDQFPAVPAGGLNAWVGAAAPTVRFRTVSNGTSGPAMSTTVSFSLAAIAQYAVQGSMSFTGLCVPDPSYFSFTLFRTGRAL